ncbi:MAG: NAD(P)/FAD-dependent oxidoreductase [Anaerolineae bacterium]|nr:NAD(P)/FAD-dependent oxidoreductase [Anaerolineae bacterium]
MNWEALTDVKRYDVIVVGAGVVGALCARELTRYGARVLVLEKGSDVCSGASKANSGIVHACLSPKPGSNKARLCLEGNRLMPQLCRELGVPFMPVGALTVAFREREVRVLSALRARGERNGERGLEILRGPRLREAEPALSEEAVAALLSPSAGIVNPMLLTIAAAENAVANGAEVLLEAEVTGIIVEQDGVAGVRTTRGDFGCRFLVNAAGAHADRVMRMVGITDLTIHPRRGDYFVLDRSVCSSGLDGERSGGKPLVRHVLFPIPTPVTKGILVTPTVDGNVLLGPTSLPTHELEHPAVSGEGLAEVERQVVRMVPSLDLRQCIAVFAGSRPAGARDFIIRGERSPQGLITLAGIESPGLTAAPAIARRAVALLGEAGLKLRPDPSFDPIREPPPRLAGMPPEVRAELVARDPAFGRIVCRCEEVSEGEIVAAIRSPIPARTLDAIKKRVRVGAGRCQGGFDLPYVVEILARELGIAPCEVTKSGTGSEVLMGTTGACRGRCG